MGVFRNFPYSNFHEMNLDEILKIVDELSEKWDDFSVDWSEDVVEQVNKWLDEHPEATTTVQDGSITTAKLADRTITFEKLSESVLDAVYEGLKEYDLEGFGKLEKYMLKDSSYGREFISRKPIEYYTNDADYKWLQSAVYVDYLDHVILGFSNEEYTFGMLVEVDKDFTTIIRRVGGLSLGHVNDMAYNPITNKIYVATMDTGAYANKIVEVNVPTLDINRAIDIGDTVYQISYDRLNNVYHIGTHQNCIYDENFELIKANPWYTITDILGITVTGQGSEVYKGNYILLSQNEQKTYWTTYNYNNGDISQIQEYDNASIIDEAETLCMIPNKDMYLLSGQRYVTVIKMQMREDSSNTEMFNIFDNGEILPQGTDLNDIYQAGKYLSIRAAETATMLNVPSPCADRGFSLYVFNQAYDWVMQVIVGSSVRNLMLFRTKEGTNAWGAWQWLYPKVSMLTPTPLNAGGSIQIPIEELYHYSAITLTMHRNYWAGSITLPTEQIRSGDAQGCIIWVRHDWYWEFKISSGGLLTINTVVGSQGGPFVRMICHA